jgi:hypothetical protein
MDFRSEVHRAKCGASNTSLQLDGRKSRDFRMFRGNPNAMGPVTHYTGWILQNDNEPRLSPDCPLRGNRHIH